MSQNIQPLRIQKNTPSASPNKMNGTTTHRPLAELGLSERRRNSPSYNQATKKPMFQNDSSPFETSPMNNSPRLYWQSRDPGSPTRGNAENRDPREQSPSPAKRSSIENLKRASRVKNSSMFAREQKFEYDPASSPMIERPLAQGRPFSPQLQAHAFGGKGLDGPRVGNGGENKGSPLRSQAKIASRASMPNPVSASNKAQNSPTKSSLSNRTRYAQVHGFDPENGIWSDEEDSLNERQLPAGKSLHRHAKSVTFDVAPPQVNEYEQATPDPSSVASGSREGSHDSFEDDEDDSFDRSSSFGPEDSFDASLEDTEKTPVVLPEDWRFMSPEVANDELTARVDDPFNVSAGSPAPTARPSSPGDARASPVRTDSRDSSGESRPLPPLPPLPPAGLPQAAHSRTDSRDSFEAMSERVHRRQRSGSSPARPASITKAEIQGMSGCSMPIEDRLKLMMLGDDPKTKSPADEQRERKLRRGSPVRSPMSQDSHQQDDSNEVEAEEDDLAGLGDYEMPPRISRESILRNVRDRAEKDKFEEEESSFVLSPRFSKDLQSLDPDMPLPSTEIVDDESPKIKRDPDEESEVDVYAIPDLYSQHLQAESFMSAMEKLEAIKQAQEETSQQPLNLKDDDDESHYSVDSSSNAISAHALVNVEEQDDGQSTPKLSAPNHSTADHQKGSRRMSLPQFAALLGDNDFDFGMDSFMTEGRPNQHDLEKTETVTVQSREFLDSANNEETVDVSMTNTDIQRPITPEAQLDPPRFPGQGRNSDKEPRTPDSVIRHSVEEKSAGSPGIPEPVATIKASGSRLKTRQSATPADIQAMAEVRRQVSGEIPAVPKVPEQHHVRPSVVPEGDEGRLGSESETASISTNGGKDESRQPKRKSSLVALDLRVDKADEGLGIDSEFDRLLEAQKKGYLMRQNTKVIVASSASHESQPDTQEDPHAEARGTRSAGNSPRKPSQTTWTTEPWNGKVRRKSIRKSGGVPSKPATGPAPPLPGQQSNVASGLDSVAENESVEQPEEIGEDGERGRLFVKVVRVKDLDLPLPRGERSYFALTLDNGLHCVTTSWLELGKTAPIGQEFELVVLDDLEFQLTLQTRLEEPKPKPVVESPTKAAKATKSSAFSRVFASPKKRKEMEIRQQEEAQRADRQRQQDAAASRRSMQPTAWDLLHNLVAKDGSFARSYVSLKDHEASAYGKAYVVDVPCFNEWATEEAHNGSSARSKRPGSTLRRPPYRVGKLELQLFYVPKPKGAKDEDMPKSMNACIRELKEAEAAGPTKWSGHLSQQGGDCPYWRRRYFSLDGSKFTAYHEATRQPRATINLAKASKLIDDKSALMKSGKGSRRKSAFAEEEEGYMFVEEGFRMRFANGETIDFYADSAADKDGWMKALSEVVGKDMKDKKWTDIVLARHRAVASRAQRAMDGKMRPPSPTKPTPASPTKAAPSARSAPPTPAKNFAPRQPPLPVPEKSPRRSDIAMANRRADAASKTRSMIF